MVIDFHTHIFPEKIAARTIEGLAKAAGVAAATGGTLQELLDSMERSNVDLSVIVPVVTKPAQFETVNRFAAEINEKYKGSLLSFGGIHPDSEDYRKELDEIARLGLPGIKLHPDYQNVMIDDPRYMRIIEYANELGLVILVHAGIDIGLPNPVHCPPDKARKVIDTIKPDKFVLAHYGGWKQWDEVYELIAGENVYLDTAFIFDYIADEQFLRILQRHGSDKVLFATDSPWSDAKRDMERLKALVPDEVVRANILSGNARRLLGI